MVKVGGRFPKKGSTENKFGRGDVTIFMAGRPGPHPNVPPSEIRV